MKVIPRKPQRQQSKEIKSGIDGNFRRLNVD